MTSQKLATQAQQLRILEAELRQAERAERLGVMQASAAMSEANDAAVELITLRKDKQELLQEEEDLTNRLHELTAEHREAQKSFEIAQSAAQVLMRRRQERLVKKLEREHVDEMEALRLEKEQALRAEHEAAAAVLRRVVEAAAAAVLGVDVLRQPPAEARAEEARLELERGVHDRRDDAGDREVEEARRKRAARALHHRLEAVAARARDPQREAHAADEGDGLDD